MVLAQPDTGAKGSGSKGMQERLNFLELQVAQAVLQPLEAGKPLPRAGGTTNGLSRLSAVGPGGCRLAFSQRPYPWLFPVFWKWQLDMTAKRPWFPESSSENHRGDEEARKTTPECSKGGRLTDDPQNLGMEQVPIARLWEQSQPGSFLSL